MWKSRHICTYQRSRSPAVIFIAGHIVRGDLAWESSGVFSEVSKFTKAVDYDRPGTVDLAQRVTSRSDPITKNSYSYVTAEDQVHDLRAIVTKTGIKKPFILVAHSVGGLIARLYAYKYPGDVAGMVLIDVSNEIMLNI